MSGQLDDLDLLLAAARDEIVPSATLTARVLADAARHEMMEQGGGHRGGRHGGHDDGHAKRHGGDDDGEGWFDWGGWGDDSAKEN